MRHSITKRNHADSLHESSLAFWMIEFMHDNPLLPLFKNPYRLLEAAGLEPGQIVIEVGCGPGFFTIPAAKIVGKDGLIYAIDVNHRAVKRVEGKMQKYRIANIKPILGNAADSGLPEQSIDLVFIFGLRYVAGGLSNLISGIHTILKPEGILSFEKTMGSDEQLLREVETAGFTFTGKKGRILIFKKGGNGQYS